MPIPLNSMADYQQAVPAEWYQWQNAINYTGSSLTPTVWIQWVGTNSGGYNPGYYGNGPIWNGWCQNATTYTITPGTGSYEIIWNGWVNTVELTKEQKEAQAAAQKKMNEEYEERKRKFELARVKALALFEEILSPAQREEFKRDNHVHCVGNKGRRYRIRCSGQSGNVDWMDGDRARGSFCAHPTGVPDPDAWIAQMLHLQTDEDEFLRVANLHRGERPVLEPVAA